MTEIRETTPEDIPDIQRLWADGEVMRFVGFPEGLHHTEEEMNSWYQRLADSRPSRNHYVVLDDGVFCGETFYSVDKERDYRADLDIKLFPGARGRGIATTALTYAIEQAFCHGAETVCVTPNVNNAKAIALYERLGFEKREVPQDLKQMGDEDSFLYMERTRKERDGLITNEDDVMEH